MAGGTHTAVETLANMLLHRWVPKWYEAFSDMDTGGFYERLGHSFRPVLTGERRLVTQCRQLALYSHAAVQGMGCDLPDLARRFDFITRAYRDPAHGGWYYSLDDAGKPRDRTYDLYATSFVIFACVHYYRAAGDPRARDLAAQALAFIDRNFRLPGLPGLAEALDQKLQPLERDRRHESHMHLLESCLFAADITGDPAYRKMADEMVDLFVNNFYRPAENLLSEYYTGSLSPKTSGGNIVLEPGHYCEWIWLLKKHAAARGSPDMYDSLCRPLLEWALEKGWDDRHGGIYDELNEKGEVIADTKRIWPLTEALKACALMMDSGMDRAALKTHIRRTIAVLRTSYMQERGFWTEWLRRDLKPETDYMPGTTPYHVYFGIMETRDVLRARGPRKSLAAPPRMALYNARRYISSRIRDARFFLKGQEP